MRLASASPWWQHELSGRGLDATPGRAGRAECLQGADEHRPALPEGERGGYAWSANRREREEEEAALLVRVRLGAGLSRLATGPLLTLDLAEGATVEDLYVRLREAQPELGPALRAALPVVAGEHVAPDRRLADRQEIALLLPVAGG